MASRAPTSAPAAAPSAEDTENTNRRHAVDVDAHEHRCRSFWATARIDLPVLVR